MHARKGQTCFSLGLLTFVIHPVPRFPQWRDPDGTPIAREFYVLKWCCVGRVHDHLSLPVAISRHPHPGRVLPVWMKHVFWHDTNILDAKEDTNERGKRGGDMAFSGGPFCNFQ